MDSGTLRLPRLPEDVGRYVDLTMTGRDAADAASLDAPAPLTSFDTIVQASTHMSDEDPFGVIGHDLDHPSRIHRHDYLEITHTLRGTVLVWAEGETHVLQAGSTILVKPEARHLISPIIDNGRAPLEADILVRTRLVEDLYAMLPGTIASEHAIRQWLDDDRQSSCLLEAGRHPDGQAALSRLLVSYCTGQRYRPDFASYGNLMEFLHATSRALERQLHNAPLVQAIIDAIATDPAEATNNGIAATLGYSVGYLSRYTRKHTGHTLGNLINTEKLRRSAELLVTTNLTIAQIAHVNGYDSVAYFHKLFREHYLITPDRYRNDFRIALRR